jgi:hypothetical protein
MVIISGHVSYALWIQVAIAAAKWLALMALASQGAIGAAAAYLISEIAVALVPAIVFCQRSAGLWLDWRVTIKVVACAAAIAMAARYLGTPATLLQGALAVACFFVLAAMVGAIRIQSFRQLLATVVAGRDGRA